MEKSIIEYNIIFKENTELYKEYDGEFISEDKEETDRIFNENKEQVEQYFSKEWIYDDSDYVEGNVEILYNAIETEQNIKKQVIKLLDNIKNKKDGNYEIITDFEQFPELVKFGRNKKEKLQVLIMCYCSNPTIEELENLTLQEVVNYIKDTDEYYNKDKKYINKCIEIIKN